MAPKILAYLAISVDGFIAAKDGGVDWLNNFNEGDMGFDKFIETISTVIMGRKTFEQTLRFPCDWPYAGKKAIIISSNPISQLPELGVWRKPCDIPQIIKELRGQDSSKDAWIVGGKDTVDGFLKVDGVDMLEIYIMPLLLKGGIPLFDNKSESQVRNLQLIESKSFPSGVVKLQYKVEVIANI